MQSIKSKAEDFLKSNPNCRAFLCDYIKKAEKEISDENEKMKKETVIEEFKNWPEYNVANFSKLFLPEFKFKLELLKKDHSDFKLLGELLHLNELDDWKTNNTLNIYGVIPTKHSSTESNITNFSQFLLLHGTKAPNVEGILKTGFKPSEIGTYGPGVYLTNDIDYAYDYGMCLTKDQGVVKCFRYFFVNQLSQKDVQVSSNELKQPTSYEDYLIKDASVQLFKGYTKSATLKESENDKFDSKNNKILQGTFMNKDEKCIIGLAHHDLVTPVYLIEVEDKLSLEDITQKILYEHLDVDNYVEEDELSTDSLCIDDNNSYEVQEYTLETITKELEKEITRNQQAMYKCLVSELDNDINSIMKQLTFNLSSIIETTNDEIRKYRPELLQKEDGDYKFILQSLTSKNANSSSKMLHVFKINPVDAGEVNKIKDKCLYLNGITSNNVNNILIFGYPEKQNNLVDDEQHYNNCYASTLLEDEIEDGISYCEVDNVVKKLSFVFVVSSEDKHKDCCNNLLQIAVKNKEIIKDSRGSCAKVGLVSDETYDFTTHISCPAYLIIFELE